MEARPDQHEGLLQANKEVAAEIRAFRPVPAPHIKEGSTADRSKPQLLHICSWEEAAQNSYDMYLPFSSFCVVVYTTLVDCI
jgi:hypothetical protein